VQTYPPGREAADHSNFRPLKLIAMKTYEIFIRTKGSKKKKPTGVKVQGADRMEAMRKTSGRFLGKFISLKEIEKS